MLVNYKRSFLFIHTISLSTVRTDNEADFLNDVQSLTLLSFSTQDEVIAELAYFYPDMFKEPENNTDPDYRSKIMLNNFLKVVVFYEDLNHEKVTEFRAYTVSTRCPSLSYLYIVLPYTAD